MAGYKKTGKGGTKKRGAKQYLRLGNFLSAGFFISVGIIATLAFVSFQLSLICLGILALASSLYLTIRQRNFWERAASFKFKTLEQNHKKLEKDVIATRDDIALLRKTVSRDTSFLNSAREQNEQFEPLPSLKRNDPPLTAQKPGAAKVQPSDHEGFSDLVVRELVHNAIRSRRIDVFMQPIVRLPQRQPKFFEVFGRVRARAGLYLPAERYMGLATEDRLINSLDHLLLMECLKTITDTAHLNGAAPFFINITSHTMMNPGFMKALLDFIARNRQLAPRLIFEIKQKDFEDMQPAVLEILRGLGKLGCALSIDHVKQLDFDLKFLQVLKVRFVKINAADLLMKARVESGFGEVLRLKRRLEGNGIGFIVERIENEQGLVELLDYDIHYGQGFLFGRPALESAYRAQYRKSA